MYYGSQFIGTFAVRVSDLIKYHAPDYALSEINTDWRCQVHAIKYFKQTVTNYSIYNKNNSAQGSFGIENLYQFLPILVYLAVVRFDPFYLSEVISKNRHTS